MTTMIQTMAGLAGRSAESAMKAQRALAEQGRQAIDTTLSVSHDVVRAGLGAAVMVQEEGSRLYGTLVERGAESERRGLARARELRGSLAETAGERRLAIAGRVERTGEAVSGRVGALVQTGVVAPLGTAMERLGVPTRAEVRELAASVAALSAMVDALIARLDATRLDVTHLETTASEPAA